MIVQPVLLLLFHAGLSYVNFQSISSSRRQMVRAITSEIRNRLKNGSTRKIKKPTN
jgi:hypothetical protein